MNHLFTYLLFFLIPLCFFWGVYVTAADVLTCLLQPCLAKEGFLPYSGAIPLVSFSPFSCHYSSEPLGELKKHFVFS